MNSSYGDNFIYEVERPAPDSPNLDLAISLRTSNYAFCESGENSAYVMISPKPMLNAALEATPEVQVYPDATISLKNTSLHSNAVHHWDFGDDNTSALVNPLSHTYEKAGNYVIKLKLEESNCLSEDSVYIYIQPAAPIADFSFDPGQGCAPLTVNFTNHTQYGDPDFYRWYFGEGERAVTSEHPSHTYYEPGVYSVKLEASNSAGVTDFAIKKLIIEVFANPHADFSIRPETVKLPEVPIYTTNLSLDAEQFYWDFGDGNFSDEFEPSHIYVDTGRFDITLIASTAKGCIDTVTYENIVEVIEGNDITIPNAFTPSLDGPTGGSRYMDGGRNDVFFPVTEGVIAYHMQIYNRWGEMLFSTTDTGKGWDGYYRGRLCAPDVYIYKIDFKFIDGREVMKFGDITLIR
jgi:gliding motility-associated-like protein